MKKLFVIALGMLLSLSAQAQDSKRERVEELLRVANADSIMENIYSQMNQVFDGMGGQLGFTPDEQPIFDAYMSKVVTAMKEDMSWDKMKEPMIDIYLTHYTDKEINDMLVFYKSDTGRSMVKKMPVVLKDTLQLSQQMMQTFFPKLKIMAEEFRTELEAHRSKQSEQPGD